MVVTHVGFQSGRYADGAVGAVVGRLDFGVTLFFVLSGFLLGRPFALWALGETARPSLRRYAVRRAARILPAYWLMLTVVLVALRPEGLRTAGDVLAEYLLLQSYGEYGSVAGLSHLWSLSTEVAFYAVLPLLGAALCALARRSRRPVRALLVALGLAGAAGLAFLTTSLAGVVLQDQATSHWLPSRFDWFAVGLVLAVLTTPAGARSRPGRALSELAAAPGLCWAAGAVVFWIACTPVAGGRGFVPFTPGEALTREVLYAVAALLLLVPVVAGPRTGGMVRTALQSRPAAALGQVSYGVFLWHLVVLEQLQRLLDLEVFSFPFLPVLALTLAITVPVAALSWRLLERPVLAAVDRRLAR